MELMVVIGIVTIVGVVIGPGLKKAYEDFHIKKTLNETDMLISSYRSYYLIFNQMPNDCGYNELPIEVADFVPSIYAKKKGDEGVDGYNLTISPYGHASLGYDFQNWIFLSWSTNATYRVFLAIGGVSTPWLNRYLEKYKKIYSNSEVKILEKDVIISFPEMPAASKFDTKDKNRYY